MNNFLCTLDVNQLDALTKTNQQQAQHAIEAEQIIYLPNYSFTLNENERVLLSESILHPKHKNISYDYSHQRLAGLVKDSTSSDLSCVTQEVMRRFATYSKTLIDTLLPHYTNALRWGRTSYRPAEIKGRASSKRKDDTRVHVDSFASTPVNGLRILRIFCNINPHGAPRVWHVGEPFHHLLHRFEKRIPSYNKTVATLLHKMRATKTLRSAYDHYMLHLHDKMKLDEHYQQHLNKSRIDFPSNSTWIVFTDNVSHAALSGQFLLEQTFYLPAMAMKNPELSPLKQWERLKSRDLVII